MSKDIHKIFESYIKIYENNNNISTIAYIYNSRGLREVTGIDYDNRTLEEIENDEELFDEEWYEWIDTGHFVSTEDGDDEVIIYPFKITAEEIEKRLNTNDDDDYEN